MMTVVEAVLGGALLLAWLYGRTESILVCILFHAGWNAVATFGLAVPSDRPRLAVLDACLRVAVGPILLVGDSAISSKRLQATSPGPIMGRRG